MGREFELKFEVPPEALAAVKALPSLRDLLAGRPRRLTSVYFDSPKSTFLKAGMSLRVRREGRRYTQTIKARQNGYPIDRSEWEKQIPGPDPDLAAAEGTPLEPLLENKSVRKGLGALFSTKVERIAAPLAEPEAVIEVCLDVGVIEAGPRSSPLCELELELKKGDPQPLFDFARTLIEAVPIRLGLSSKSERGHALLGADRQPARAETPALHKDMTPGEAFREIVRGCTRQLVLNEALLRNTRDPDALHQTRVAARRLRAAIWFFNDAIAGEQSRAMNAELRWIARLLGEARDLDVFLRDLREGDAGPEAAGAVISEYEQRREGAYVRVMEALASARFRMLTLDAVAWTESGAPGLGDEGHRDEDPREPIKRYAASVLKRRRKSLLKRGADLESADDQTRHRLRIQAKKLRYSSEFLAGLYGGKARKRHKAFVGALETLQESLGALNDRAKAEELRAEAKAEPTTDGDGEEAPAAAKQSRALLKEAARAYADFAEAEPFWK